MSESKKFGKWVLTHRSQAPIEVSGDWVRANFEKMLLEESNFKLEYFSPGYTPKPPALPEKDGDK